MTTMPELMSEEVEEVEEVDMMVVVFDWKDDNASAFLKRWEVREEEVGLLNPSFSRPLSLLCLYKLLLEEFCRDIDGANRIGSACIHCATNLAYGGVTNRMGLFEMRPWVTTIIGGELPACGKLADIYLTSTVHKMKYNKFHGRLF